MKKPSLQERWENFIDHAGEVIGAILVLGFLGIVAFVFIGSLVFPILAFIVGIFILIFVLFTLLYWAIPIVGAIWVLGHYVDKKLNAKNFERKYYSYEYSEHDYSEAKKAFEQLDDTTSAYVRQVVEQNYNEQRMKKDHKRWLYNRELMETPEPRLIKEILVASAILTVVFATIYWTLSVFGVNVMDIPTSYATWCGDFHRAVFVNNGYVEIH